MKIPEDSGKLIGQLRRTQLITTFGPGSLVDMPDCSVIVSDASMWEFEKSVLHDERLERFLGVKYFREPLSSEDPHTGKGVIKSFRFPEWCYCPNCHRLAPAYKLQGKRKGYCGKCKENDRLVPSTFVIACENGHIEDFPYSIRTAKRNATTELRSRSPSTRRRAAWRASSSSARSAGRKGACPGLLAPTPSKASSAMDAGRGSAGARMTPSNATSR